MNKQGNFYEGRWVRLGCAKMAQNTHHFVWASLVECQCGTTLVGVNPSQAYWQGAFLAWLGAH